MFATRDELRPDLVLFHHVDTFNIVDKILKLPPGVGARGGVAPTI